MIMVNDLGNGVQINITSSTSYNDSPNQIYGEDLYLDIQGATINTTKFTETEVSGEGGTEIEGQYYIEYDRQTDTDWITDFDGNNIDWYILILPDIVDAGEGEGEGEGEGNNNIGQGELGGGVGFEGTVAIQDRARVFYRNNTTQEYIEFNNSVNINNFNNTANLNDCVFNGYSVSLSKNNNILMIW